MISWKRETSECWVPCSAVPIDDRAVRFGMSLFETVLVSRGRAVFLDQHLSRLSAACSLAEFPDPRLRTGEIQAVLDASHASVETGLLRIYLTAEPGGALDPIESVTAYLLFQALESIGHDQAIRLRGEPVASQSVWPGTKSGNYWGNVIALRAAHARGFNECVLTNHDDEIVSCAMANLFVRAGGRWLTPPCACGARNGVVREWVMARLSVGEEPFGIEVLRAADAAMVTNSRIGPAPVVLIGDRPLSIPDEHARLFELWIEEISAGG
jgi:branched-subunit amino acid aminotransferase/4-amino-4-deoxychorismate lyase